MISSKFNHQSMASCLISLFTILYVTFAIGFSIGADEVSFNQNYHITWGHDHILNVEQEGYIQLSLDQFSGAGFATNLSYGSGFFHMRMKMPDKDSTGVVTAFYLTSHTNNHDELDFEFLGNDGTTPYTLQTNVFVSGQGDREQRIHLWFDPTKDFHSYQLLWNQYQIVFYVDNIPIRVFKNLTTSGVAYPSQPMQIEGSIWNGEGWASHGKKIDWSQAPFKAQFQGFDIDGCASSNDNMISQECYSSNLWWNEEKLYSKFNITDQKNYESVSKKYTYYDYCFDKVRNPITPPEC